MVRRCDRRYRRRRRGGRRRRPLDDALLDLAGDRLHDAEALLAYLRHLGHVDGLATATQRWDDARAVRWRFEAPMALLRYVAHKGSVCVDGVSLTVNAVDDQGFEVALIPHTVEHTAFHALQVGNAVNIEVDLLARYVERLLATKDSQ